MRFIQLSLSVLLLVPFYLISAAVPDSLITGLETPSNIRIFADYLYDQKDFLRAYNEYSRLPENFQDDTVRFRTAAALGAMGKLAESAERLEKLITDSRIKTPALSELLKTRWLMQDYNSIRTLHDTFTYVPENLKGSVKSLYFASFLDDSLPLPEYEQFADAFPQSARSFMAGMYKRKSDPPYKSPLKAAAMSALIPGLGKIYAGQISDGITAFLVTGVLGYLSWDNFRSHHDFRAWTFTGLAALFYAGNIYGSAAQAQIFNAGIQYNFQNDLNIFMQNNNYLLPRYAP